ncbi:tyrosine-type recombinase/integrase [Kutzneria sp. NPDC052558]|uniref:tyrosine-type recombinase/integrase n=1 Tax=Kutzneria sp. NPDC052558 TaxID=3364121 RepID=UPI0037CB0A71
MNVSSSDPGTHRPDERRVPNERLRARLAEAGWTSAQLASAVNAVGAETGTSLRYDRTAVAHWLAGVRPRGTTPALVAEALARRLRRLIRPADVGFAEPPATTGAWPSDHEDPLLGLIDLARADLDPVAQVELRLAVYQPHQPIPRLPSDPPAFRRELEGSAYSVSSAVLAVFRTVMRTIGGRHARGALLGHLVHDLSRWPRRDTRHSLAPLATELAVVAALMCGDDHAHGLAQRYCHAALALAAAGGDTVRYALGLWALSLHARHLGHHQLALGLISTALATAANQAPPLTTALWHVEAARCHAAMAQAHSAHQHLAQARQAVTTNLPPAREGTGIAAYGCTPAYLAYGAGHVHRMLGDSRAAEKALRAALRDLPVDHHRPRVLALAELAVLHYDTGRFERACEHWHRFLDHYPYVQSARADDALATLRQRARPFLDHPVVHRLLQRAAGASGITRYRKSPDRGAAGTVDRDDQRQRHRLPAAFAEAFATYSATIAAPTCELGQETVRAYRCRVRKFLEWLAATGANTALPAGQLARDDAAEAYRIHLSVTAKRRPTTVNGHLAALNDFYQRLGLEPARAGRMPVPKGVPHVLGDDVRDQWLTAAMRADVRAAALACVSYYTGARVREIAALDLDDVRIAAAPATLTIRGGPGGRRREVPMHPLLRKALRRWITERAAWAGATGNPALFLNRRGGRLTARGAYDELRKVAVDAGRTFGRGGDLTPSSLRHTAEANMIRHPQDSATAAALLGRSTVDGKHTSDVDKRQAVLRLTAVDPPR